MSTKLFKLQVYISFHGGQQRGIYRGKKLTSFYRDLISNKNIAFYIHLSFPKVDHSARSDRMVLVEYTTGSVVELNFC